MGDSIMRNLQTENVFTDYGKISIEIVTNLEKNVNVILPQRYVRFIIKHNGAQLNFDIFDYFDTPRGYFTTNSIAFLPVEEIKDFMQGLSNESIDDPGYFYEKLIPFGDNGGGDFICFDYRTHNGDNPPIILWSHDVSYNAKRISFIANNFEEFINMLHEPED